MDYVTISVHLGEDTQGLLRKQALERLAAEAGHEWGNSPSIGRWLVALADRKIQEDSMDVKAIEITVNASDLHDFLSDEGEATEGLVRRRMDAYVVEAKKIIQSWYPNVAVSVDHGETPGYTVYEIETVYGWERNPDGGPAYDVRVQCDEAFNLLVNDWDWCPNED